ncbi:MAG: hypothetical protein JNN03_00865 [Rubrivivax sp.]|nr:hypothetical protein [Rubrivivax sp.]
MHRFLWGYGPAGYDILFREGERRALESPCLDEVGRWKLAVDREAQVVTPVHAEGQPLALLAFRSRVSVRPAGDRFRETACAVVPWAEALEPGAHEHLLDLVPPFPEAGDREASARRSTERWPRTGAFAHGAAPAWVARAWARLLDDQATVAMAEGEASWAEALGLVALLPPAVARRTAVGAGLLPGSRPGRPGLFIASTGAALQAAASEPQSRPAPAGAAVPGALDGLAAAWFRRTALPHALGADLAARGLWERCAAEAECDISQFEHALLLRTMLSDAACDWLCPGSLPMGRENLARWFEPGLSAGVAPSPPRLARLIDALPPPARREAATRLPHLAARLDRAEEPLAVVLVAAALAEALRAMPVREAAHGSLFDPQTWLGALWGSPQPKAPRTRFAAVAWALLGELLAVWAARHPDVLARALARPARQPAAGSAGWLRGQVQKLARQRTVADVLRQTAQRSRTTATTVPVPLPERLLPEVLHTGERMCTLQFPDDLLEEAFADAVLAASKAGSDSPAAHAAAARLLVHRQLPTRD